MSEFLTSLSNALAETVDQASTGVVQVEGRERLPASGIIWSSDGIIVTTHHILERDDNLTVGLPDGSSVSAILVGRDPTTDLAVLRADTSNLTSPTWAEPDTLKVGHLAIALGRPGQSVRATLGIVNALGKGWRTPAGGSVDRYLQTDLAMYPGFSGGPLVNAAAEVVGVNSSALLRGVSITLPTPTVRRTVEALVAHGRIRRGYLGVGLQPTRLPAAVAQQIEQETGILLTSVEPGSPAEQGNLFLGDTIISLAGEPVRHPDDLLALLSGERVGQRVPVRIIRGGQLQEQSVTIGERP